MAQETIKPQFLNMGRMFGGQSSSHANAVQDEVEGTLAPFSMQPLPSVPPSGFGFPGAAANLAPQPPAQNQYPTFNSPQIPSLGYPGDVTYSSEPIAEDMPVESMSPSHWGVNTTSPGAFSHDSHIATPVVIPNEDATMPSTFDQSHGQFNSYSPPSVNSGFANQESIYQQSAPANFGSE